MLARITTRATFRSGASFARTAQAGIATTCQAKSFQDDGNGKPCIFTFLWAGTALATAALTQDTAISLRPTEDTEDKEGRKETFRLAEAYEVKNELGEGGCGRVFRASRKTDGVDVALKMIDRRFTNRAEFRREISALTRITEMGGHPHVCQLFDVHENDALYYVTMELVEGGELYDRIARRGAHSEELSKRFVRQLAEALSFIHACGITHADLKPENVMLSSLDDENARLKVVDFGCAVSRRDGRRTGNNPTEEISSGTTAYWAPELFEENGRKTPATDMWATGCILYALLTGSHPFDETGDASDAEIIESLQQVTNCAQGERYLLDKVFNESRTFGLSSSCLHLLKSLLHPNPKQRMTSNEFLRHPWVGGEAGIVRPKSASDLLDWLLTCDIFNS